MSCRFPALSILFILFLRVQSISLANAHSSSSVLPFDLPEIDGSAVDTCRIFPLPTPDAATTTTTTTTTTTAPTTLTPRKQVVVATKKPAVQTSPRMPETKNTVPPVRPQPAPARPITNSLLYYLLTNSRRHAAGLLPRLGSILSQPVGGLPGRGQSSSDSDELAATLRRGVRRREGKRWRVGSLSSEDSSDES